MVMGMLIKEMRKKTPAGTLDDYGDVRLLTLDTWVSREVTTLGSLETLTAMSPKARKDTIRKEVEKLGEFNILSKLWDLSLIINVQRSKTGRRTSANARVALEICIGGLVLVYHIRIWRTGQEI